VKGIRETVLQRSSSAFIINYYISRGYSELIMKASLFIFISHGMTWFTQFCAGQIPLSLQASSSPVLVTRRIFMVSIGYRSVDAHQLFVFLGTV
jgi:hypothetical protein